MFIKKEIILLVVLINLTSITYARNLEDGLYETFQLGELLIRSDLQVFNRYGGSVYHSPNYNNEFCGCDLASGVYYYAIRNTCFKEIIKGPLSILK